MRALPSALRLTCCRSWLLLLIYLVFLVSGCSCDTRPDRLTHQLLPGDDVHGSSYINDEDDLYDDEEDYLEENVTAAKGQYLGSPCDVSCNPELQHVFCDTVTGHCECEKFYPVRLGPSKGCAKPKKLGEQCFYRATCTFADQHSTCTQVQHNAVCDCEEGYHRVALSRPNKKVFCAEDLVLITTDIPTLLCIASGIAIFTAMICFVLKLFSRARYSRPRHYANANHAPPMLFSSDTGIPLTLHGGRPSSRSSQRSSTGGPLTYAFTRRPSSGGSRGPLVPASRAGAARAAAILLISCHLQATKGGNKHRRTLSDVAEGSSDGLGSRRPSLTSVHSSTSSARSYSARRLEKERNEKEQRQALQELRLAKQREQQQQQQQQVAPTPSPRTPHSTDELLPSVEEGKEVFYNEVPTTSDTTEETTAKTTAITATNVNRFGEKSPVTTSTTSIFETNIAPRATGDIFQV
ncbi:uncharacterized protein LOC117603910 isoform X2 [Osmia lignaria lignaria]|uniref:uncharacterized protein LOC114879033 isoform X2 n=1 Tax=Osmia bicornis bicornis TaxID=1437191 RepID=UPI0010F9B5DB|nr:uncharacterized protein LOC114879033 isoform X2 [Osmia bicornis bicornis]XP_034179392.1 uncharacterized protein LOC117603910 isoform X2 [Osmia lignaria]